MKKKILLMVSVPVVLAIFGYAMSLPPQEIAKQDENTVAFNQTAAFLPGQPKYPPSVEEARIAAASTTTTKNVGPSIMDDPELRAFAENVQARMEEYQARRPQARRAAQAPAMVYVADEEGIFTCVAADSAEAENSLYVAKWVTDIRSLGSDGLASIYHSELGLDDVFFTGTLQVYDQRIQNVVDGTQIQEWLYEGWLYKSNHVQL